MTEVKGDPSPWEEACFRLHYDAALGRMFRGLLHNLNGVMQSFSMQTELYAMMFPKVEGLLADLPGAAAENRLPEALAAVGELLRSRAALVAQGQAKVESGQRIMRRVMEMSAFQESLQAEESSLNAIVQAVVEFLNADTFFKHKVRKEFELAPDLPLVPGRGFEVYQVLFAVLENANEALQQTEGPCRLGIKTVSEGKVVRLLVEDSGPGLAAESATKIFAPFFTTKPGHLGLGLYLAQRLLDKMGGTIACESRPGLTCFSCSFPGLAA